MGDYPFGLGTKVYPQGYRTYSLSLSWSSSKLIDVSFTFIIGPHVTLVDWPFHYHFSHAKNEVSAPRKVSILTSTTAVRVLSTFLGVPWPLVHPRFFHQFNDIWDVY